MVAASPSATTLSKVATADRIVASVAVNRPANALSAVIRGSTEGLVTGEGPARVDDDGLVMHPVTPSRQHPQTNSRTNVAIKCDQLDIASAAG
jgi:hypothetical protein